MIEDKQIPQPDLNAVLRETKQDVKNSLNAVNIGRIESFNESEQTATIRLVIKQVQTLKPNGARVIVEHPLLVRCPVMTLFGGQSFVSLPIQPGDTCIVLFNDREIDNWHLTGDIQAPNTRRTHDISDAMAIVGIRSLANSITQYLADGIRIQFAENSKIDVKDDAINSLAQLFTHTGNFLIEGNLTITGNVFGDGTNNINFDTDITQVTGRQIRAGNGATGTFDTVTVVDGIVTGGS